MELIKSNWVSDGDSLHIGMPVTKIDRSNRTVSGFATLDNMDQQDDVVTVEASKQAFAKFRGNMREMHQPIAIGKLVSFKEDGFYDTETKKFYRGIYVTAYISKGAEDTWQKVLDGTLSGFSIGGDIKDSSTEFVKEAGDNGRSIRFIKKFNLTELSLVDSPANQLTNVDSISKNLLSISKSSDGSAITGLVADTEVANVFWCDRDKLAKTSSNEVEKCFACDSTMKNIDWFEKGDSEAVMVEEAVAKFLRQGEDEDANKQSHSAKGEGGVEKMADNEEKKAPAVPEEGQVDEVAPVPTVPPAEGHVDEVANEEPDFEKMFDNLKDSVAKTLEDNRTSVDEAISKAVGDVEGKVAKVAEAIEAFDAKTTEFTKALDELGERLGKISEGAENVQKRLDSLESLTAIKKSGDVEETEPEQKLQKGLWAGAILS